ncbi:MAG: ABC transporter permease [Anaerolineae bacterium]|nr:ABC transporter permease [Anaerolineae bacterium]
MYKEFLHMFRDLRMLSWLFLIPIVQLFLLAYAANPNVDHLRTAVLDLDHSTRSRDLLATYQASNYFDITHFPDDQATMGQLLDLGQIRAGLIIPAGFGDQLGRKERPQVKFIIDGSDPTVANAAYSAAQTVGQAISMQLTRELVGVEPEHQPGLDVRPRVWYNPDMRSENFMVPGVVGLILQMLSMMMTAMAIVREREQGTMEQLVVTPIRPYELILGKVTPYAVIVFINVIGVLTLAVLWFKVPIHGSVPWLLLLTAFAMITTLALGLLISTIARSQQEAMLVTYLLLMPSIFLSGYIFPLEAMPAALRFLSNFVPLRYLLVVIRGIILKGVGLELLRQEIIILGMFSIVILALATTRFQKKLE